jgi:hypothetical protein
VPEAIAALDAREQLLANLRLLEADLAEKQGQLARAEVAASHGAADKRLAQLRQVGRWGAGRAGVRVPSLAQVHVQELWGRVSAARGSLCVAAPRWCNTTTTTILCCPSLQTVSHIRVQVTQGQQHYVEVKVGGCALGDGGEERGRALVRRRWRAGLASACGAASSSSHQPTSRPSPRPQERNKAELVRLQLERYVDFKQALGNFAAVQAQLMAAASDIWASAAQLYTAEEEAPLAE